MKETKDEMEKKKKATSTTAKTGSASKKATTTKSSSAPKKARAKKSSEKADSSKEIKLKQPEYYDLPYRYNQTVIKILAQTPHALFICWDIADSDKQKLEETYGPSIWTDTKPVLLVHNKTLNTSFEINIDDFTNSWYLHTPTSDCVFDIELGRRKIADTENQSNLIQIACSNTIKSPNDHILKEQLKTVYFKNVKTNELEKRDVSNEKISNIYNLIDLYNDENGYENNPSSGFKIS